MEICTIKAQFYLLRLKNIQTNVSIEAEAQEATTVEKASRPEQQLVGKHSIFVLSTGTVRKHRHAFRHTKL